MPEPPPLPSGLPSEMLRNRPDIRASGAGWPPPRRGSAWPSRNAFRASSFRWTWAARPVWSVICSRAPAWPGRSAPAPVSRCTTAGGPRRDSARRRPAPRRSAWPMNTACGGPSRTWRTRWPANAERERQAHLSAAVRDSLAAQDRATRLYRSGLIGYLPVLAAQQATYRARDELALNALARSRTRSACTRRWARAGRRKPRLRPAPMAADGKQALAARADPCRAFTGDPDEAQPR